MSSPGSTVKNSPCSLLLRLPSGSVVKNLPVKEETQVGILDREDPLEKEMATHSSILA